jgi:hypothetical protein
MPRKSHSIDTKVAIANAARHRLAKGEQLKPLARQYGLQASQLKAWMRCLPALERKAEEGSGRVKTIHSGRPSSLNAHKDTLLQWFYEIRQGGMPVTMRLIVLRVSQLSAGFRRKGQQTKYSVVRRFLRANNIVIRVATHEAQKPPKEAMDAAKAFVHSLVPTLRAPNRQLSFILNMDQTPVYFSMTPNTTLETRGVRSVNIRSSSGSTMRVTVAVTVTANGELLTPMLVFKGKPGGRIEQKELPDMEAALGDCVLVVQERAWMNEVLLLLWVEKILKPWAEQAPEGVVPLLLLDSYKCHIMASVVDKIHALGVQVEHIPGGCTGLAQPVDVGIGKPLKNRMRNCWEDYMIEIGLQELITKPPSRRTIVEWVLKSLRTLPASLVRNAWRHSPYSYFPNEPPVEGVEEEDEEEEVEFLQALDPLPLQDDVSGSDSDDDVLGI